jgi:hypothetical protein
MAGPPCSTSTEPITVQKTKADLFLIQGKKPAFDVAFSFPVLAAGCDESNDGKVLINLYILYYK